MARTAEAETPKWHSSDIDHIHKNNFNTLTYFAGLKCQCNRIDSVEWK
ncbi:unnamed protein product [Nezara viridula]|uniref:Uncharacterized protein n=1 Tax=Nezara viridula TaxID=85310 RepID=A0A9P0HM37_NEZVI|nr:unnamed protein product [Nezara viridula]